MVHVAQGCLAELTRHEKLGNIGGQYPDKGGRRGLKKLLLRGSEAPCEFLRLLCFGPHVLGQQVIIPASFPLFTFRLWLFLFR